VQVLAFILIARGTDGAAAASKILRKNKTGIS
jgi:hypothetical protein